MTEAVSSPCLQLSSRDGRLLEGRVGAMGGGMRPPAVTAGRPMRHISGGWLDGMVPHDGGAPLVEDGMVPHDGGAPCWAGADDPT
jgi:hypothetical protein